MIRTKLDQFTRAYIDCALWSSTDESNDSGGEPLDRNYSVDDLAPEALESIIAECADFQTAQAELLAQAEYGARWTNDEMAGHDFWLTRNHHGAGFWDRGLGDVGRMLTDAAHGYGESNLYVGDDNRLYVTPCEPSKPAVDTQVYTCPNCAEQVAGPPNVYGMLKCVWCHSAWESFNS